MERRAFIGGSVATAAAAAAGRASAIDHVASSSPALGEIDFRQIAIDPQSTLAARVRRNAAYLLSLDNDRMLFSFRAYAGLPNRTAQPYGGWESPTKGFRGHFVGHYLSALAKASCSLVPIDPGVAATARERARDLSRGLAECQSATAALGGEGAPGHPGYLNAQSPAQFDRLEALQPCDVPYYVIHKILAGLIDAHRLADDPSALATARGMAAYFGWRMDRLPPERIVAMLETRRYRGGAPNYFMEFGGMHDVLLSLYEITREPRHLALAGRFDRAWFREMLALDNDALGRNGEHANTEIPNVIGIAHRHDLRSDDEYRRAALNFLGWMRDGHEFATGGVSGRSAYPPPLDYGSELFNSPRLLDRQINGTPGHPKRDSGESCCSHNLNRLSRYGVRWTRDGRWGDAFENRYVNAVLAQQDAATGMMVYNLRLGQGVAKEFGTAEDSFWCCYGTGAEAFASIAEGAWFHDRDDGLWVNAYQPGTLAWPELGLSVEQRTRYPDDGDIRFRMTLDRARSFTLNLRIPAWAEGARLLVNGAPSGDAPAPGRFAAIAREWRDGDTVALTIPFALRTEHMIDRPDYVAVRYGPNLLVACRDGDAVFTGSAEELRNSLVAAKDPCTFTTRISGAATVLAPIRNVTGEAYSGYVRITRPPEGRPCDAAILGDEASERAHRFAAAAIAGGEEDGASWRETAHPAGLALTLAIDPSRRTYLRCHYSGDDGGGAFVRLFDIEIAGEAGFHDHVVATQSLDREAPGRRWTILYPLPLSLTRGRTAATIRFRPKGFDGKPGRAGRFFDRIETIAYDI